MDYTLSSMMKRARAGLCNKFYWTLQQARAATTRSDSTFAFIWNSPEEDTLDQA